MKVCSYIGKRCLPLREEKLIWADGSQAAAMEMSFQLTLCEAARAGHDATCALLLGPPFAATRSGEAFEEAIKRGHTRVCQALLQASPCHTGTQYDGARFAVAAEAGNLKRCQEVLKSRNLSEDELAWALAMAGKAGQLQACHMLLQLDLCQPTCGMEKQELPADVCLPELLLGQGAAADGTALAGAAPAPKYRDRALVCAAGAGMLEVCQQLQGKGASVRAYQSLALVAAASSGQVPLCRWLLQHGTYSWAQCSKGLLVAAKAGNLDLCKLLLTFGAEASAQDSQPLIRAVEAGNLELCRLLLKRGAQAYAQGSLALVKAAEAGHLHMCQALLEAGARAFDRKNRALIAAATHGALPVCRLLLAHGAQAGRRSLEAAALAGNAELCKLLMSTGARDTHEERGVNILILAARGGHAAVCQALLKQGGYASGQMSRAVAAAAEHGHSAVCAHLNKELCRLCQLEAEVAQ